MADPIAYTRRTRTPVYQDSLPGDMEGQARISTNPIYEFLQSLPILNSIMRPSRYIGIDPTHNPTLQDKAGTIGHEEIHQLLRNVDLHKLNEGNPFYPKIAQDIELTRAGNPQLEAPAYVRTPNDLTQTHFLNPEANVTGDWISQYRNKLIQQLVQLDPKLAKSYGQLTDPGVVGR